MELQDLRHEHFAPRVNDTFQIRAGSSTIEARLIEARKLGTGRRDRRDPFSLIFRGPRGVVVPQSIYQVDAGALGTLDIFLVTIGPDPDEEGMLYEAIFT